MDNARPWISRRVRGGVVVSLIAALCIGANTSPADAITNGTVVAGPNVPFMASVLQMAQGRPAGHLCGGTLIAPRYVLTAKHCNGAGFEPSIGVAFGSDRPTQALTISTVRKVYQNPNVDAELLELYNDAPAAPLPVDQNQVGTGVNGFIYGYCGDVDCSAPDGVPPTNLRRASVVTTAKLAGTCNFMDCTKKTSIDLSSRDSLAHAARKGDSGGPFIVLENGQYQLAGLMTDSNLSTDTIALRTSTITQWISRVIANRDPVTVPDAPRGLTLSVSTGRPVASWSPPLNDGGAPVTGYTLYLSDTQRDYAPITVPARTTSYTFTNVAASSSYSVLAASLNRKGPGPLVAASTSSGSVPTPPPVPTITTDAVPPATAGTPYTAQLTANGGTAPYSWAISAGSLPPAFSLSSTGVLSGTATDPGTFSFTAQLTDGRGVTASKMYALTVSPAGALTFIAPADTVQLSTSCGTDSTYQLLATGGTQPYTWSITSGTLPTGITLSDGGTLSAQLSTAGGSRASVTVQVRDATGATATGQIQVFYAQCF